MSERYQITPEDEAAFRRSALEQIALRVVFVGEGIGAPQAVAEASSPGNDRATVDESVTIEAKE